MKVVSKYTKKNLRNEKIAKGIIWLFAGLTIAILFWIVGYILVKGFYYNKRPGYEVTYAEEEAVLCPDNRCEFVIITNRKIKAKDLTFESLYTIYTKERRENWGFYTQQDIKVHPYTFKTGAGHDFANAFMDFILYDGESFSKYTNFVKTPEEMIEKVGATKGGIGILPADYAERVHLKKVNMIPLRRTSVVVHPSVIEIRNNRMLQNLEQDAISSLFTGEADNWQDIGGLDMPVRIVLPPNNIEPYASLIGLHFEEQFTVPENAIQTGTMDEYVRTLRETYGAAGLMLYKDAVEQEMPIVEVERQERGLNLTLRFLVTPPARSGKWGGISSIIINTLLLILLTIAFSTPIGVAAAVYLVEYAKQGRLVNILRMGTETLAGIPSIVFGLFGHIIFVRILGIGIGFITATLTVTLMILPTIIRTAEEALKAVPLSFREGSLALGATKLQTIWKVVIPAATPGILTGIILAIGRVVGETAVLLYTLGSSYSLVDSLTSSARVLSLHLYLLFSEAISFERAFATASILVFIIIIVNFATTRLIGRMNKMAGTK